MLRNVIRSQNRLIAKYQTLFGLICTDNYHNFIFRQPKANAYNFFMTQKSSDGHLLYKKNKYNVCAYYWDGIDFIYHYVNMYMLLINYEFTVVKTDIVDWKVKGFFIFA